MQRFFKNFEEFLLQEENLELGDGNSSSTELYHGTQLITTKKVMICLLGTIPVDSYTNNRYQIFRLWELTMSVT